MCAVFQPVGRVDHDHDASALFRKLDDLICPFNINDIIVRHIDLAFRNEANGLSHGVDHKDQDDEARDQTAAHSSELSLSCKV